MVTILRGYTLAVLENAESGPASGGVETSRAICVQVSEMMSRTTSLAQVMTDEMVPHEREAGRGRRPVRDADRPAGTANRGPGDLDRARRQLAVRAERAGGAGTAIRGSRVPSSSRPRSGLFGRIGARNLASGYASCGLRGRCRQFRSWKRSKTSCSASPVRSSRATDCVVLSPTRAGRSVTGGSWSPTFSTDGQCR